MNYLNKDTYKISQHTPLSFLLNLTEEHSVTQISEFSKESSKSCFGRSPANARCQTYRKTHGEEREMSICISTLQHDTHCRYANMRYSAAFSEILGEKVKPTVISRNFSFEH